MIEQSRDICENPFATRDPSSSLHPQFDFLMHWPPSITYPSSQTHIPVTRSAPGQSEKNLTRLINQSESSYQDILCQVRHMLEHLDKCWRNRTNENAFRIFDHILIFLTNHSSFSSYVMSTLKCRNRKCRRLNWSHFDRDQKYNFRNTAVDR